jgi:ankyrin repeat protein
MAPAHRLDPHLSPLFAAIDTGNGAVVDALLNAGARVESTNDAGETPLHAAAVKGEAAIVRALLLHGAHVDARIQRRNHPSDGRTPLMAAALSNNLSIVKLLLENGADPSLTDASGTTALTFAEISGKRTANYLRKITGVAPAASQLSLHDAASAGLLDRVVRLLADGVPIDARDDLGNTALHRAAMSGHRDIVGLLLHRRIPVDAPNSRGNTALTLAATVEVAQLLRDAGAADIQVAPSAVDPLRDEMKTLAQRATEPKFTAAAERVAAAVHRRSAPWKRRKGVLYFHSVAVVDNALERLQAEVREKGFTLVYINAVPEENGRLSLILLPTPDKYGALLACGTNGINKGHDTAAVISWLMAMEAEHPFVLVGCGHDFLHGRLTGPVRNAEALAARMIAFCPDMVEQAQATVRHLSRPDQIKVVAGQLSSSGSFEFWWD